MGKEHFFLSKLPADAQPFVLDMASSAHIRARRIGEGALVSVFDGEGQTCVLRIVAVNKDHVMAARTEDVLAQSDRTDLPRLHLIQAMPKGLKLDDIVKMSTELGVDEVHLAVTERTIVRPKSDEIAARVARWQRIAASAAEVVGRTRLPHFHAPKPLLEIAKLAPQPGVLRLVCWEESALPLIHVQRPQDRVEQIWIVIGPEGGLSLSEVKALEAEGFMQCSLAPYVMRVETAVVCALAQVHAWIKLHDTFAHPH